jgi:hypothetical protein
VALEAVDRRSHDQVRKLAGFLTGLENMVLMFTSWGLDD